MPDAQNRLDSRGRILIIDDEEVIRDSLETLLGLERFEVHTAVDGAKGLAALGNRAYDLVLLDLMLPDRSGLEVLEQIRETDSATPVVMLTAYGSVETAVKAVRLGADDFFTKPWNNDKLVLGIEQTITRRRLESENARLRQELRDRYSFANIVGKSEPMQEIFRLVGQVAPSRSTVLITGESGTGKELIAKALHANSPRADGPFIPVNSGSIPVDLLESALFGHIKGAFTGAAANRKGFFEAANGGTLFLDEIATLTPETQAKLLRVLQEREFMPVGSNEIIRVDVRIVAATNEDLEILVEKGEFREDLYYRLNVIGLRLPPLRDRSGDIPLLVQHFFDRFCRENEKFLDASGHSALHFSSDAMAMLMDHRWPGNVRELENAVERAVVLATKPEISVELLPEGLLERHGVRRQKLPVDFQPAAGSSLPEIVEEFERRLVIEELEKCGGNQTETAKRLRVALSTLNQKIQRLGIDVKKLKAQA
ncbi:MAG: response regulator [Acidobacteria bacterium]|nr:response regulator [Acidobacteriota bacterium]